MAAQLWIFSQGEISSPIQLAKGLTGARVVTSPQPVPSAPRHFPHPAWFLSEENQLWQFAEHAIRK
jgi:hypothetical protein